MKKTISGLYATIVFLSLMIICSIRVHAIEPDFQSAIPISFDNGVRGSTTNGYRTQQNVYKFTVTKPGGIYITLKYERQNSSNACWSVDMYNDKYEEMMEEQDIPGNVTATELPVIGVDKGVYYIAVMSPHGNYAVTNSQYTLVVHEDTDNMYEKERNESFLAATSIGTNQPCYGSTVGGRDSDKDYFSVNLPSAGAVTVNFAHEQMDSTKSYWEVEFYDEEYHLICSRDIYGNTTSYSFPSIGLKGGTCYVLVESCLRNYAESTSRYELSVNFEKSDYWEKEQNEQFTTATPIDVGSIYYGTTSGGSDSDVDYYRVDLPETTYYNITMNSAKMNDSSSYYRLALYDSTYKELASKDIRGTVTTNTIGNTYAAGTYYILVASSDRHKGPEQTYSIRVAKDDPAQAAVVDKSLKSTKITSLRAKKKSVTVKWKKQTKGINGYEIQYSTDKKFKKDVKTVTINKAKTASKTIKKLKSKKKYFFRIRTFKKSGAGKAYSNWSKTKNVKVK